KHEVSRWEQRQCDRTTCHPVKVDVMQELAGRDFDTAHDADAIAVVVIGARVDTLGPALLVRPFAVSVLGPKHQAEVIPSVEIENLRRRDHDGHPAFACRSASSLTHAFAVSSVGKVRYSASTAPSRSAKANGSAAPSRTSKK